MGADYQATVTLRVENSQFMSGMDQVNQQLQKSNQSGQQFVQQNQQTGQALDQTGTKAQTTSQKMQGFGSSMAAMAGSMLSVTGGIIGIVQGYTSMEKAQTMAQRSTDRYHQALITEQGLELKLQTMREKGLQGTAAYAKVEEQLALQHSKVSTAAQTMELSEQRANERMAEFWSQLVPSAMSAIGGIATAMATIPMQSGNIMKALSGVGSAFTAAFTNPAVLAITITIALVIAALVLLGTNAFGVRDKFIAAMAAMGKAIDILLQGTVEFVNAEIQGWVNIANGVLAAIETMVNAFITFGTRMSDAAHNAAIGFNAAMLTIYDFFVNNVVNPMIRAWNTLNTALSTFFGDPAGAISRAFAPAYQGLLGFLKGMGDAWNNFVATVSGGAAKGGVDVGSLQKAIEGSKAAAEAPAKITMGALGAPIPEIAPPTPPAMLESRFAGMGLGAPGVSLGRVGFQPYDPGSIKLGEQLTEVLKTNTLAAADFTTKVVTGKMSLADFMNQFHIGTPGIQSAKGAEDQFGQSLTNTKAALTLAQQGANDQTAALNKLTDANGKAVGEIDTYGKQLVDGSMLVAQYNSGVDDQKKKLLDSVAALAKTAGAQKELDTELAQGAPQAVAYAGGILKAHDVTQQMQISTAGLQGEIQGTRAEFASGQREAALYAKSVADTGLAYQQTASQLIELDAKLTDGTAILNRHNEAVLQGKVNFDKFIISTQDAATTSTEYNNELTNLVDKYGTWNPLLEKNAKNIEMVAKAMLGDADAAKQMHDELTKAFDGMGKAVESFISKLAGNLKDINDTIKKPFKDLPKEIQKLMTPEDKDFVTTKAKFEKIGTDVSTGFALRLAEGAAKGSARAGAEGGLAILQGYQNQLKDAKLLPALQPAIDALNTGLATGTEAGAKLGVQNAIVALEKLGPEFKPIADSLATTYGIAVNKIPGITKGVVDSTISEWQRLQTQFDKVVAATSQIGKAIGLGPSRFEGVKLPTTPGPAGPAAKPAAPGAIDTSGSIAALNALQAQAQAVANNIVKMVAGVAVAFKTWFNTGAQDAAGSLNNLVSQAQADMNDIAKMPTGVANSLNTNFNKGANDAAGSLNDLTNQAQADMNDMAKMPTGVATSLNSNFNRGANDAAGALNNLQNKAQGVMNNIVAAAASAARAVAAVGAAIRALPDRTVRITVDNSQALSAIRSTQSAIDSLHGKNVTNTVTTHFVSTGTPALQYGYHGIVNAPTTVLVGEAGPERLDVTPMGGQSTSNLNFLTQGGGRGSGAGVGGSVAGAGSGREITIVVNLGGREIWREVRKNIFEDISQF